MSNNVLLASARSRKCSHTPKYAPLFAWSQLQPTLRSESRGGLHTMPSREEETPPLWWGKIAIVIQFFCFFRGMLFWHLACRQNPHIRQVCCGFAAFDQLKNSYCYTIFLFFRSMLFWHLLRHENAHIRFSMLRFLGLRKP